jgi:hypothetical protein
MSTDWLPFPGESLNTIKKRRESMAREEGWVYKIKLSELRKELSTLSYKGVFPWPKSKSKKQSKKGINYA